jgi:transposase
MLRVSIFSDDLPTIHRDRFYHPRPHIMIRMHTLALHHAGESAARIAVLLDRNPKTIRACLHAYRDGGLQAVYKYEKHKHESELEKQSDLIVEELTKHPPQSVKEAGAVIERLTGESRSLTQIGEFLKKKSLRI